MDTVDHNMDDRSFDVLLVEDNSDHAYLEKEALKKISNLRKIDVAGDSRQAVDAFVKEHYDLVLIDLNIPGKDGLSLLEELRGMRKDAAFVLLTGMGDETVAVKAMKAGAYDYIKKDEGYLSRISGRISQVMSKYFLKKHLKSIKMELKDSETKLRALVDYSPNAVFMKDIRGEYVFLNKQAIGLLAALKKKKYPRELDKGLTPLEEQVLSTHKEAVSQEKMDIMGKEVYMEISKYPVLGDRDVVYICTVCRDITERKKEEWSKDTVIRDVSHEFKTPLAVLNMAHYMCVRAAKEGNIEKVIRSQDIVNKNLSRLLKNVDNILELFKMDSSGKRVAVEQELSLSVIVQDIIDDISYGVESKKINLNVSIPEGLDKFYGEHRLLRTLMYNVIDNAVKFTDEGEVSIKVTDDKEWVLLSVEDSGCGITPDMEDKVFDRFIQKDRAIPGSGVGLTICKEIVDMYKGKIEVSPGKDRSGTKVSIRLPMERVR